MAESCTRLPLLERFPQHVRQKANQNVRLDTGLFVMPDRTDAQIGFLNTEGGLSFGQLNVGLPQLFVAPVVDIAAQDLRAFSKLGPIVPLRAYIPLKLNSGWCALVFYH